MSTAGRSDGISAPGDGEQSMVEVAVQRVGDDQISRGPDLLAVEEPLEIRLVYGPAADRVRRSITVTMRTPGRDVELAVGFLFAEGVVRGREDIADALSYGPRVRSAFATSSAWSSRPTWSSTRSGWRGTS
jgi:hypothetical protein